MDAPRLGHLTELPLALRFPLAAWFSEDRTAIWALSDGLVPCPGCQTMRAVFQITRRPGGIEAEARCIGCAKEPGRDAPAKAEVIERG